MNPRALSRDVTLGAGPEYYTSDHIYQQELAKIFRPTWNFAAHGSELPDAGSFVTFSLDGSELVVVRDDDGDVQAYHNFCRHRGHRLCSEPKGSVRKSLVCPYHGWSYGLSDGACLTAPKMGAEFSREDWGLRTAWAQEHNGLVFVCLAETPPAPLGEMMGRIETDRWDLSAAKVAFRTEHEARANWKVVWENFHECYHCAMNHPELCKWMDLDVALGGGLATDAGGQAVSFDENGMTTWEYALKNRAWPSMGPNPLSQIPLAGSTAEARPSMGTCLPTYSDVIMRDYAWLFTIKPLAVDRTVVTNTWLVHADAVEGVDYVVEDLVSTMRTTNDEDMVLCEEVQAGLALRDYVPGPVSHELEADVIGLQQWCRGKLEG